MMGGIVAALSFPGSTWSWVALGAAVVLVPLGWLALAPAGAHSKTFAVGLVFRTLGIGILAIALLDPQWTGTRAAKGENVFAVMVDNSQSLTVTEAGDSTSRGLSLRGELIRPNVDWLTEIANNFNVRPYAYDRTLRRVRDFGALDFAGDRSDLYTALRGVRQRHASQPLAGILLFTDGNATDPGLPAEELAEMPAIYPVVVGQNRVADVRLDQITVRQSAFDDAPVSIDVDIVADADAPLSAELTVVPIGGSPSGMASVGPEPVDVRIAGGQTRQTINLSWKPGGSGIRFFEARLRSHDGREIADAVAENNQRLLMVDLGRPEFRILYVGGRPSWDFKFLNRALLDDPQLAMVSLLRVARREPKFEFKGRAGETSNPMYRGFDDREEEAPRYDQPVLVRINTRDASELRDGFPNTAEELFAYDAIMLDDIEAGAFGPGELSLIRRFVSERGGGLMMLGGADSLESGDYAETPLAAALPLHLFNEPLGFDSKSFTWNLTREGWLEPWVRVRANESAERIRLQDMRALRVAHNLADVKPGAMVLATFEGSSEEAPALVVQRFGRGRTAVLNAGDLWRWGVGDESNQMDLARFWRQVARWLVAETSTQVSVAASKSDEGATFNLTATVRDKSFRHEDLAKVDFDVERIDPSAEAPTETPKFTKAMINASPVVEKSGRYTAGFPAVGRGGYLVQASATEQNGTVIGHAETGWVSDPAAEEFRSTVPNTAALASLARATGGEVLQWDDLKSFAESLPFRAAPMTETWTFPIWNTAWVFLVVLLCFLAEWGWRRWRGMP